MLVDQTTIQRRPKDKLNMYSNSSLYDKCIIFTMKFGSNCHVSGFEQYFLELSIKAS